MDVVPTTKRYVGDDRFRVRLFETIAQETRRVLLELDGKAVKANANWSDDEVRRQIGVYDDCFSDLCQAEALVGRWGRTKPSDVLAHAIKRTCDSLESSGNTGWLRLQWYPTLLLLYAGGIGTVAAGRFDALMALMHAPVRVADGRHEKLVSATADGLGDGTQFFKLLAGLDRKHVPCSEHLHDVLNKLLDDVLYLGSDYELSFDTFEILRAIEYAHLSGRGWGPIGRFGWRIGHDANPWQRLMTDAQAAGNSWPPVAAGLCGGSSVRLKTIADQLLQTMSRAGWY
jgi:hypothetical protein